MDIQIISALAEKSKCGDGQALTSLYEKTVDYFYFYALKVLSNEADAFDALQSSYVKIITKIHSLNNSNAFLGWAKRIVYNECCDIISKNNKYVTRTQDEENGFYQIDDSNLEFLPEEALENSEMKDAIFGAFASLPGAQKQIAMLFYYEQLKAGEIAEIVGTSENSVHVQLYKARKKLKDSLQKFSKKGDLCVMPLFVFTRLLNSEAENTRISPSHSARLVSSIAEKTGDVSFKTMSEALSFTAKTTGNVLPKIIAGVIAAAVLTSGTLMILNKKPSAAMPMTNSEVLSQNTPDQTSLIIEDTTTTESEPDAESTSAMTSESTTGHSSSKSQSTVSTTSKPSATSSYSYDTSNPVVAKALSLVGQTGINCTTLVERSINTIGKTLEVNKNPYVCWFKWSIKYSYEEKDKVFAPHVITDDLGYGWTEDRVKYFTQIHYYVESNIIVKVEITGYPPEEAEYWEESQKTHAAEKVGDEAYAQPGAIFTSEHSVPEVCTQIALSQLKPGDIIYYKQSGPNGGHVALYIGNEMAVHGGIGANDSVKILSIYQSGMSSPQAYRP